MEKIWNRLVYVISMYFSLVYANDVNVDNYTNKLLGSIPYEKLASGDMTPSLNITYQRSVLTEYQKSLLPWSCQSIIPSTYMFLKKYLMLSNYKNAFNDKQWPHMWYNQDFRTIMTQPVLDINVVPVYFELGITGKNVNILLLDSGIEKDHPELVSNFNPDISWNFNFENNDITPDITNESGFDADHGTKCAGIIIMKPNNKLCGVGIAYGAMVGGVKLLDDYMTISKISKSLIHAINNVDVYSNSWGTSDSGNYMEPLHEIITLSFSEGTQKGRDGRGAVYIFSAGNGKHNDDNCACDKYVNSIHTIVIASCNDSGHPTMYSERCAAITATAYGDGRNSNLVTTDLKGKCTNTFCGTSAASAILSGVVGLAISANPKLQWRDLLHLLAWTSQVAPLSDNLGWNRNRAGFYYSVDFGFGLINAYKLVKKALMWKNVPNMNSCFIHLQTPKNYLVSRDKAARIILNSNGCKGFKNEVKFIEQVQLIVTMRYPKRGDIQIAMISPAGTEIHVLENRSKDSNPLGLKKFTFLVLAFWGESPRGQFVIDIYDKTGSSHNRGKIENIDLIIHGTKVAPSIYKNGPRPYEAFKLPLSVNKNK